MHDIKLNFINNSSDISNASIVLFQEDPSQDAESGRYPLAWKVFPLKGPEQDVVRSGSVFYTATQSLGVIRNPQHGDPVPYGKLEIFRNVQPGDKTVFTIDQHGALDLALLPEKNDSGVITCINNSGEAIPVSLYKSGSPLATMFTGPQTVIAFRFSMKLFAACMSTVEEEGGSRMVLSSAPVQMIDLTHSTEITITLRDSTDGKQDWLIERS